MNIVFDVIFEVICFSLFGVVIIIIVYILIFSLIGVEGKMFYLMVAIVVMVLLFVMVFLLMVVFVVVVVFMNGKISEKESIVISKVKFVYKLLFNFVLKFCWVVVGFVLVLVVFCLWLVMILGLEFIF